MSHSAFLAHIIVLFGSVGVCVCVCVYDYVRVNAFVVETKCFTTYRRR